MLYGAGNAVPYSPTLRIPQCRAGVPTSARSRSHGRKFVDLRLPGFEQSWVFANGTLISPGFSLKLGGDREGFMSLIKKLLAAAILALTLGTHYIPSEIYYPWKDVFIGALDASAWPGLVFVASRESAFAFALKAEVEGRTADPEDMFYLVSDLGPNSPDGQYARIRFDLGLPFKQGPETPIRIKGEGKSKFLTMEWSRQDERTVIGRIKCPKGARVSVRCYSPWDFQATYDLKSDGFVHGQSEEAVRRHFLLWFDSNGQTSPGADKVKEIRYAEGEGGSLYFVAGVGESPLSLANHLYRYKNRRTIDSLLKDEESGYKKKRTVVGGLYSGVQEAVCNPIFWSVLYQPGQHRLYVPAGRNDLHPRLDGGSGHWTIHSWESLLNALVLAVESPKHAVDAVDAVLETQYPNGNIPQWRGRFGGTPDRSQPPIGSYVVLKLFQKTGDMDFLRHAFPYLEKWHAFWTAKKGTGLPRRDGNNDGLLEWGSDTELLPNPLPPWEEELSPKQRALLESGHEDLLNWDEAIFNNDTGTLQINCLDLNCIYTLDAWCLSQIAGILGRDVQASSFLQEHEKMRSLINSVFWDEREGFYFDRSWDGRFSHVFAASNFLPLAARIPDEKRALRMIKHLLDPKKFWGDFVVPAVSRDSSVFKNKQAWRGAIRPSLNYFLYQGLKTYGFDAVASDFVAKEADLFLRTFENFGICPESFDPRTGEPTGERFRTSFSLFGLIAIEEYMDFTPWEGFRFGMIDPPKSGKLSRMAVQGRHYDVYVSRSKILLEEEGKEILRINGCAVFRRFLYNESEVSFEVKCPDAREIRLSLLKKGKYQILIDNKEIKSFQGKTALFKLPAGNHAVVVLLIEEKD